MNYLSFKPTKKPVDIVKNKIMNFLEKGKDFSKEIHGKKSDND